MKRILVRMTGTHPGAKLGDFLMATPALAGLRAAHPDAEITLLLWPPQPGPCCADPALFNEILWDDAEKAGAGAGGSYRLLRQIRERRFDAFVALNSRSRLAWICRLANIPRRIGSTGKYHRALYTENIAQDRGSPDRHEIEFNYDLMRPLGVSGTPGPMVFPVMPDAEAEAERLRRAACLDSEQPCIVLNPTYGGSSRALPADCFAQAAQRLNRETGLSILLIGGAQDAAENACLARTIGAGVHDLTGKTSVAVLAALLRQSALHISIDTGDNAPRRRHADPLPDRFSFHGTLGSARPLASLADRIPAYRAAPALLGLCSGKMSADAECLQGQHPAGRNCGSGAGTDLRERRPRIVEWRRHRGKNGKRPVNFSPAPAF